MMNDTMPTTPRWGCDHTAGAAAALIGSRSAVMALITRSSLVAAVRIFRMLQVPERPPARDRRHGREVVGGRRRAHRPFERPGIPRISSRSGAFPVRNDQIRYEHEQ